MNFQLKRHKMRKSIISIIILFLSFNAFGQVRLDKRKIEDLKQSTVRILIDNQARGTGFIVSSKCEIITCWHVINSAISVDSAGMVNLKKIEIEYHNGIKQEVGIFTKLLQELSDSAVLYDFCLLGVMSIPKTDFKFLKPGSFSDIEEGDIVYTCGYPLGINQQIVATGILSTKWVDTIYTPLDTVQRDVAWLDMTMNKGNSGGPVLIYNENGEDKVIGIATFILNPFGQHTEFLSNVIDQSKVDVSYGGISQMKVNKLFSDAITSNSIGVSGCIDLNHLLKTFGK